MFVTPQQVAFVRAGTPREDAVDAARARSVAAEGDDEPGGVEAVGQPQLRSRGERHRHDAGRAMGHRRRGAAGRACGSRSSCRSRRASPKCRSTRRCHSASAAAAAPVAAVVRRPAARPPARGAAPPAAGRGGPPVPIAGPVAYTLQVSMDGARWGTPVGARRGRRADHRDRLHAGAGEVRPHHADRRRRGERAVGDRAGQGVRQVTS